MGIMKPRNRGENKKYLSCHHLVILHRTFTDPFEWILWSKLRSNRACLRKASAIRLHTSCLGSWDVRETSNKQQWIWRWKRFACFFSIHSLVPGQFLCQTFLLVILFHIFPSCIAIDHFWGIFSWPLPFFPNKFLPTFSSPPARPSWDPWHHRFFGWKMRDIRVANLSPDLPLRPIGIWSNFLRSVTRFVPTFWCLFVCQIAKYRTFLIVAEIVNLSTNSAWTGTLTMLKYYLHRYCEDIFWSEFKGLESSW